MSNRNHLKLRRPSSWHKSMWRGALPAGNGYTGTLMHGAIAEESVIVTRHDLWYGGGRNMPLPDISESLHRTRAAIDAGRFREANDIMTDALNNSGFREGNATPLPLGVLQIQRYNAGLFYDYSREIDMENAETRTQWTADHRKQERRLFVSRQDDTVYLYITGNCRERYAFAPVNLEEANSDIRKQIENSMVFRADVSGGLLYYAATVGGVTYGAVVRILGKDIVLSEDDGAISADGGDRLLCVKTFSGTDAEQAFASLTAELCALTYTGTLYRDKLEENRKIYGALYDAVSVELADEDEHNRYNEELLDEAYSGITPPALAEKLWRYGRYLFISGTAEDSNPFPLYGLWHGSYTLQWSQHVANENAEMIYRHTDPGGLSYADKALIRYYTDMMPTLEENARQMFGCRGIYVSAYSTPGNSGPSVNVPVITNWISGAGWLAAHFYRYYQYTGDRETLTERILPFMVKTALFYEDYVTYDEAGHAVIYPSVSPENTPLNLKPDDHAPQCISVKNATMDFAVMKELLSNLLTVVREEKLSEYAESIPVWEKLLSSVPPYALNADGAVKEWLDDTLLDRYTHRHLSHIYPLFPGNEISPDSDPVLWNGFRRAVELRDISSQCNWSLTHMGCIYARFGMGEHAMECIDLMVKGCLTDNFLTTYNDWRSMGTTKTGGNNPIQLDAQMGMVELVQEMAVRWTDGTLFLLPAVTERLPRMRVRNIRFPGGTVSFTAEHGVCKEIELYGIREQTVTVVANGVRKTIALAEGQFIKPVLN